MVDVVAIHAAPEKGAFAVTGGGSGVLSQLLSVPGASGTVLEATVPYASAALCGYLGFAPAQSCSERTARALAMRAFSRAVALGGDFGFAITAALATNRQRRGQDRAHFAFQDAAKTRAWTLDLDNATSRAQQEACVTSTALAALASSLNVGDRGAWPSPTTEATGDEALAAVLRGESRTSGASVKAVLPGAFNPLHDGHRAMRDDAEARLGRRVAYELSIANVDKPQLDYVDLKPRLAQFDANRLVITNAPTFVDKARSLGGDVTFVVGADTISRIAEPRYYGSPAARDAALAELSAAGCKFLVYGRVDESGRFQALDDLVLPEALRTICTGVPKSEFRNDLSSTALRSRAD